MLDCAVKLGDWETLNLILSNLSQNPELGTNPDERKYLDYLGALSKYDQGHYKDAFKLLGDLSTIESSEDYGFEPIIRIQFSEQLLLQSMLQHKDKVEHNLISKNLGIARDLLKEPLRVATLNSITESYPIMNLIHCINYLDNAVQVENTGFQLENILWKEISLQSHNGDVGLLNNLLRIRKACSQKLLDEPFDEKLKDHVIKLSRKQKNWKLANRLLKDRTPSVFTLFQQCKLDYSSGKRVEAIVKLMAQEKLVKEGDKKTASKILSTLGEWFHLERRNLGDQLNLSGQYLKEAVNIDPTYSNAWLKYADWCFHQGTKKIDRMKSDSTSDKYFQVEEKLLLRKLVEKYAESDQVEEITNTLLTKLPQQCGIQVEESFDAETPREDVSSVIRSLGSFVTRPMVEEVVALWNSVQSRLLDHFRLAVQNYFEFLHLRFTVDKTDTGGIVATLRLLKILLKHGQALQSEFSAGFQKTPANPWKEIVPQLFARLDHPDSYVRSQLVDLVMRLGKEAPHLIVYPTVVAVTTESATNPTQKNQIQEIYNRLLSESPQLVEEVKLLIQELTRITSLFEEQWMVALHQLQPEVASRMKTVKNEIVRLNENKSLTAAEKSKLILEKYSTIMQPSFVTLDTLFKHTFATPETSHERWFQNTFGEALKKAIAFFKSPRNLLENPESAWHPLKDLSREFNRFLKPTTLRLNDISTELTRSVFSMVTMPGHELNHHGNENLVKIQSFEMSVNILPTKTRPKKITIVGSNGKKYIYLIKGSEDLHLDERIMQFLGIVNQLLRHDKEANIRNLTARKYAVIPLGERSGLIQWVDGSIPLFTIYKQWQRRESINKQVGKGSSGAIIGKEVLRPSDMFYGKMIPALKEKGITSRNDWPFDVMKRVFLELSAETPKTLISRELWMKGTSSLDWWNRTKNFNRSVAVMSMIGYIIGLGDRHLDNILLDSRTGEIVHIDYNVCFEKGLKLRVPEKVPFRLTQNIENALGLTGVEGMFRIASQHTLRVLRQNKQVLLTLLEAFIYDPLVDWTADKAEDATRRNMELNICLTLFSSRIEEVKDNLRDLRDHLLKILPNLESAANNFVAMKMKEISEKKNPNLKTKKKEEEILISTKASVAKKTQEISMILQDVMNFLMAIMKNTVRLESAQNLHDSAKEISSNYQQFVLLMDKFVNPASIMHGNFLENSDQISPAVRQLENWIQSIYSDLFNLKKESSRFAAKIQMKETADPKNRNQVENQDENSQDSQEDSQEDSENEDSFEKSNPKEDFEDIFYSGEVAETKKMRATSRHISAYAVSLLKRVDVKLKGKLDENSQKLSVPEQVDHVIKEAVNVDNLCVLYEGWTSWV
eukprot:TRINITY_DN1969_c0_g5_i1.p1 TRINITY_DN1969_c0_g5~~TRINITY_DN1969_c0_g5_i1.p1  ORF type:complete len:1347 (+),score=556.40 TRINITY_DN1969_c0_g5_i1:406-4446(+)